METLTRQELHIAQFLASGKTTREAAAALFLSPKTIEYHLRSVYGKLGIGSRGELGVAIESQGAKSCSLSIRHTAPFGRSVSRRPERRVACAPRMNRRIG